MHPTPPKLSLAGLTLLAAFPTSTRAQIDLHPPGIVAAFVLTRTVSSLLYGVSAVDRVTFLGIPLVARGRHGHRQLRAGAARDAGGSGGGFAGRVTVALTRRT